MTRETRDHGIMVSRQMTARADFKENAIRRRNHYRAIVEAYALVHELYHGHPLVSLRSMSREELASPSGLERIKSDIARLTENARAGRGPKGPKRERFFERVIALEVLINLPIPGIET